MHSIEININNSCIDSCSEIIMGTNIDVDKISRKFTASSRVFAIIDVKIMNLWSHMIPKNWTIIEIEDCGEKIKTLESTSIVVEKLMLNGADRNSFIVGVGGGTICDLTGFVASIYMRGVECGFIPTTLLAQVDASVGGKNAVNLNGVKNIIGTFRQPRFVICDYRFLITLPTREYRCGLAEIIKIAIIADSDLFTSIENIAKHTTTDNSDIKKSLQHTIEPWANRAIEIKANIVANDFRESEHRKLLNLGHTFGHAIEAAMPTEIHHGEAVAIGIIMATKYALAEKIISPHAATRITDTIRNLGLPIANPLNCKNMVEGMKKDKKKHTNKLALIIPTNIGQTKIIEVDTIDLSHIVSKINSM